MIANGIEASYVWRKMVKIKDGVEHNIWWQVKEGNVSFWFDNWIKLGALYYIEAINISEEKLEVKKFVIDGNWNRNKLLAHLSEEEIVNYICEDIKPL